MEGGLRYPILLVHGLGARDRKHLCYWGRIPARLEAEGARVYYGDQDSHGSIESNGAALRDRAMRILEETGAEKLHVLAHSKGGLDARCMASLPGMAPRIASLTTVCTPHNGSVTVDRLLRLPDGLVRLASFFCNLWFRILGDKQPDSYRVFHQLTTSEAAAFNASHPIPSGVRCRSYAFVMSRACSDLILWLPYQVVKAVEGENDGLVTPVSARWADFQGPIRSSGRRGISHCDAVDLRRRPLLRKALPDGIADMTDFYAGLLEGMREVESAQAEAAAGHSVS